MKKNIIWLLIICVILNLYIKSAINKKEFDKKNQIENAVKNV